MLSINMRIFKTVLLIASFGASVRCLSVGEESAKTDAKVTEVASDIVTQTTETITAATTPARPDTDTDHYDQRQNGTENYRIHVDGVVLVFAPVEALLLAGAAGTTESNLPISDLSGYIHGEPAANKPKPVIRNKTEPAISKTLHRPTLRLANLLAPLFRRIQEERAASVH